MLYNRVLSYLLAFGFSIFPTISPRCVRSHAQNATSETLAPDQTPQLNQSSEKLQEEAPIPSQPLPSTSDNDFWNMEDVDISGIDPARKLVAFTFDDAPSRTLENIITVYAAFNESNPDCPASATIFCNSGKFDAQTPHLLATCLAMKMELGNHTHAHYDLTTLNQEELQYEIDKTDELLYKIDGKARHLLRAPFGASNEFVAQNASTPLINWTIDTIDWSGVSEDVIYRAVYENRFDGAIVLMHDGYPHTIAALKRLLPDLKADGYQAVSVSQLAKAHGCKLRRGSTYIRARKQN